MPDDPKKFIEIEDPGMGQSSAPVPAEIGGPTPPAPIPRAPSDDRLRSGRLKGLTMWGAIFVLSWPVLVESFLQALVGLVDTMLAAGISEAATDAVGVAAYFGWFCNLLGAALGVGVTALVSRSIGKGRFAVANAAVGQCVLLAILTGLFGGALLWTLAPWLADLVALAGDAKVYAIDYLRTLSFAVPAITLIAACTAALRGAGDSLTPMITMIIVNIVNTSLSFILSGVDLAISGIDEQGEVTRKVFFENPWSYDMGVHGIVLGTLISSILGALIILAWLIRGVGGVRLRAKRMRPHWHTMRRLMRIGLPNLFETFGMWFGNFLIIRIVGWLGSTGLYGAHVVGVRIESFSFLPGFAMSLAAATLTGQYLGAKRPDLARKAIRRCALVASGMMTSLGMVFIFAPTFVVGLFTQQPTHLALSPKLLMIAGVIQAPFALAIVIRGALRGAGDTTATTIITWVSTYAVRIPLVWLCSGVEIPLPWMGAGVVIPNPAPLQHYWAITPLAGVWVGLCTEIVIRFLLFSGWFIRGSWMKKKV